MPTNYPNGLLAAMGDADWRVERELIAALDERDATIAALVASTTMGIGSGGGTRNIVDPVFRGEVLAACKQLQAASILGKYHH